MSREMTVVWSLVGLHLLWVLAPLVPAVLIYKLFPATSVAVSGPLANLTVRASGAFAGYLIVFAATYPLVTNMENTFSGFQKSIWTIKAQLQMLDKDGLELTSFDNFARVNVYTEPKPFSVNGNIVRMKIAEGDGEFPLLIVQAPSFGGKTIAVDRSTRSFRFDNYNKTIELVDPIKIQEIAPVGLGVAASTTAVSR
jgi:hypothetical protein